MPNHLIIFGGSFDPPHVGHVVLPGQVRAALGAGAVAYVPAAPPPHKLERELTPAHHRLAMLRLALADEPGAVILTDELDRAGDGRPSYTVETLERLRQRVGDEAVLRLLLGADQVKGFGKWREPGRIVELAEPVVMLRPPETAASLLATLPADERAAWRARFVEVAAMDVSSSEVRRRVAAGESIEAMVPPAVAGYIREHGLYRGGARRPEGGS
ncbi:MAG: nicotinate (nicotinamide) nucleotide adenylyltransferase [Phycisphaeraceae bacterium]